MQIKRLPSARFRRRGSNSFWLVDSNGFATVASWHMKIAFRLLIALQLAAVSAWAGEAPELEQLRQSHSAALAEAAKAVDDKYLLDLEKLRESYRRNGKSPTALAEVQVEIETIRAKMASAATNGTVVTGTKKMVFESRVNIPPNDPNGYKIGPLLKGDIITLHYAGGMWKNSGKLATENPDAAVIETGEASRLAIAVGVANRMSKPGVLLAVVPPGTQEKPFSYEVQMTQEKVVLRINSGSDNKANPGMVSYDLKIMR